MSKGGKHEKGRETEGEQREDKMYMRQKGRTKAETWSNGMSHLKRQQKISTQLLYTENSIQLFFQITHPPQFQPCVFVLSM